MHVQLYAVVTTCIVYAVWVDVSAVVHTTHFLFDKFVSCLFVVFVIQITGGCWSQSVFGNVSCVYSILSCNNKVIIFSCT